MQTRAKIIISGAVQKAGYRDFIEEVAFGLNIKGFAQNLPDGTVEVVCEANKEIIKQFIEKIKITQYPIKVEDIKTDFSEPKNEFKSFDIIWEKDINKAIFERMGTAARYMRDMNKNLGEKIDFMHTDMNTNFTDMKDSYGEISKNMVSAVEGIEKMLERGEKDRQEFRDAIKELAGAIRSLKE